METLTHYITFTSSKIVLIIDGVFLHKKLEDKIWMSIKVNCTLFFGSWIQVEDAFLVGKIMNFW